MFKILGLILSLGSMFIRTACGGTVMVGDERYDAERGAQTEIVSPYMITMGNYEQDNDVSNGAEPIEWYVLDEKDGKMLLFSKYALEVLPYNMVGDPPNEFTGEITWDNCSLRKWLNEDFLNEAFSEDERSCILESEIETVHQYIENFEYGEEFAVETEDKVFLLSRGEYYDYADKTGFPMFLYRSLYSRQSDESFSVLRDGGVNGYGDCVFLMNFDDDEFIYPAFWISTDNEYFKKAIQPNIVMSSGVDDNKTNVVWVEASGGYNTDFGLNDNGEFVYWQIEIKLENSYAVDNISCSWGDITDITSERHIDGMHSDYGWKSAKDGNTHYDVGGQYGINIILPDDQSIEGRQSIIIDDVTISFDLESLGDYSTGIGWNVTNVEIN